MLNDEYIKKLFFIDHQRLNPGFEQDSRVYTGKL